MNGHSMLLLKALWSVDLDFEWTVRFMVVRNHARPIPVFQPSVVLLESFEPDDALQLWPIKRKKKSGGRGRARGRGSGRGHVGAGRGRGRGRSRGGRSILDTGVPEGQPLMDASSQSDEAECESDLDSSPGNPDSMSSSGSDTSDKDRCKKNRGGL